MTDPADHRIEIAFGTPEQVGPGDVLLAEGEHPGAAANFAPGAAGHALGCACCAPRTGAGRALTALLHGRARGQLPFFRRVVVFACTGPGRAELAHAVSTDPVARACFRLSPDRAPARPGRQGPVSAA